MWAKSSNQNDNQQNFMYNTNDPYGNDSSRNPIQNQGNDAWGGNNNGYNNGYNNDFNINNSYNHNSPYNDPINDDLPPPKNTSNFEVENPQKNVVLIHEGKPDPLAHLEDSLEGAARKNFIKKVYMVLACQLLITIGMCFASYYSVNFLNFQMDNFWLMYVSIALLIITEIVIFCCPAGRKHPINIILLLVFTLAESYMVSFITSVFAYTEGAAVVVMAACMTLFIVVCLTLYAIFTRTDFTTKWGLFVALLAPLIMLGIFSWVAWTPFLTVLYCSLGCILFGFYLVVDTQLIIGGKRFKLSMDDYVVGALLLYIDIIQIFLYLLMILGGGGRN